MTEVTLSQIKTYTEMDSHEERLHMMVEQSKINEAHVKMCVKYEKGPRDGQEEADGAGRGAQ